MPAMQKTPLTAQFENYIKNISLIKQKHGSCRVKDLAEMMHIKSPSVLNALCRLEEKGLVTHEKYSHVDLTSLGQSLAESIVQRQHAVHRFFCDVLGLDAETATVDAARIEHHLSPETKNRMKRFLDFIETCDHDYPDCLGHYQEFLKNDVDSGCQGCQNGSMRSQHENFVK